MYTFGLLEIQYSGLKPHFVYGASGLCETDETAMLPKKKKKKRRFYSSKLDTMLILFGVYFLDSTTPRL